MRISRGSATTRAYQHKWNVSRGGGRGAPYLVVVHSSIVPRSAKVGWFSSADGESVSKPRARKGSRAPKRALIYVWGPRLAH